MKPSLVLVHGILTITLVAGCSSGGGSGGTSGGSSSPAAAGGAGGSTSTIGSGGDMGTSAGGASDRGGASAGTGGRVASGGASSARDAAAPGTGGRATRDASAKGGAPGTGGRASGSGGGSATGGSSAGGNTGTSVEATSPGCGLAKPAQVPTSVDVSGTPRTFVLDVPAGYEPSTPMPMLLVFHGMGLTGSFFRNWSKLSSTFGATTFVAYADALGDPTSWDSRGTQDLDFVDALVKQITSSYCIDMRRIFATGHSSGGYFTNVVGCARGDVIRAIAPQSGGGPMGGNNCKGPLAALIIHGDSDPTVKPEEGVKSRDYWAKANGCDTSTGTASTLNPVCFDYGGCTAGYPVVYCPYAGDHNLWTEAPKAIFDFFNSL